MQLIEGIRVSGDDNNVILDDDSGNDASDDQANDPFTWSWLDAGLGAGKMSTSF